MFVKVPPKGVQLAEVGPRFEMKRTSADHCKILRLTKFPQLMKSDKGRLSKSRRSESGYSLITQGQPRNEVYYPTAPELTKSRVKTTQIKELDDDVKTSVL